jgi:hypothetical protein
VITWCLGPKAALALNTYLSRADCSLKRLILQKADVDDDECRDFVSSLFLNRNLEEIDLSENLVGSSENLNTVMPDLTTGGEALADLLKHPDCPLKTLKLGEEAVFFSLFLSSLWVSSLVLFLFVLAPAFSVSYL